MLSLSVLSTLVVTSFAFDDDITDIAGQTLLITVDDGFNPAFRHPSDFLLDPFFMQLQAEEQAFRFIQQLIIDEQLQQAAAEQRLFEEYMIQLEQEEKAREWAEFITLLQHNPQIAEMLFDQHPEFFGQFLRGSQPKDQQEKLFKAYPAVKKVTYNKAFPTTTGDVSGDALAATREETDALVDAQIAKGDCPVTVKPQKLNYFTALGLTNTATSADIKKAYHKISLKVHPDKGGEEKAFQALKAIYKYLSDNLEAYREVARQ